MEEYRFLTNYWSCVCLTWSEELSYQRGHVRKESDEAGYYVSRGPFIAMSFKAQWKIKMRTSISCCFICRFLCQEIRHG
ncbi:rCG48830 [Rattus norvegicus]|uniref:RCG48830 n=1 Tax=Rattus norvegicus TaxID=10116 RepID=A6IGW4_RAT|nr:rCG48830 [Rattus norvegicus]